MFIGFCSAQNPYHITIDQNAGLPSNSIYDIFQDQQGFRWFATGKGLSRFDGNYTKTYTADFQTGKSGSNISQDKYGRIWYENFDGYLYYVENQTLKALKQNKPLGFFRYGITENYLQIVESDGVQFYDLKTLKPSKKIKLDLNHVSFIYSDNKKLYILENFLYEIQADGKVKVNPLPQKFKENLSSPIMGKIGDNLVIISKFSKKFYYFKNGKFSQKEFNIPNLDFIQNIAVIKDDIWLCTTKGIVQFNDKTEQSKTYYPTKNISSIFLDKQNNYWISTLNEGVLFVGNFDTQIINLPYKPSVLSLSKNEILVATENDAIFSLDKNNLNPKRIYTGNLNHDVYQIYTDQLTNDTYFTTSIFNVLSNGKSTPLLIGAVKCLDRIDEKYIAYAASSTSGVISKNKNLKSDWDETFKNFPSEQKGNYFSVGTIPNVNGKSVAYNPKNKIIYYGTNNGLIAFSKTNKRELFYKNQTVYLNKLHYYGGLVYGFSSNEKLYTIDNQNELSLFSLHKFKIEKPLQKVIFQNEFLFAFTKDEIFELNLATNNIKKIISLAKNTDISDVKKLGNQYYFASVEGIIIKNETTEKNSPDCKLFIENLIVNGKNYDFTKNITLNSDENNVQIDFTVLSSIPNEKLTVQYKINNAKWISLNSDNQNLLLSALSPDDYKIEFRIADQKNAEIKTIKFNIEKPFWLKPLTLIALGIVLFGGIYLIYKRRLKIINKENKKVLHQLNLEKNVNQSKLKAIKSQMNPHFFYNALNTLQSYILSNEKKQAVEYLSKFSNLTRTILEMTEKDEISVGDEIKALTLYLDIEKARFENDFKFEIKSNFTSDLDNIKIPTMLLQPYVENAVKHGLLHKKEEKYLEINFEKENDDLKITIEDNGIGRKKSMELNKIKNKNHQSFATEATQNRIDLLNQFTQRNIHIEISDLENDLGQILGTRVALILPINY